MASKARPSSPSSPGPATGPTRGTLSPSLSDPTAADRRRRGRTTPLAVRTPTINAPRAASPAPQATAENSDARRCRSAGFTPPFGNVMVTDPTAWPSTASARSTTTGWADPDLAAVLADVTARPVWSLSSTATPAWAANAPNDATSASAQPPPER